MMPLAIFIFVLHVSLYSEYVDAERTLCTFEINFVDKVVLPRSDSISLQSLKKRKFSLNYFGFEL